MPSWQVSGKASQGISLGPVPTISLNEQEDEELFRDGTSSEERQLTQSTGEEQQGLQGKVSPIQPFGLSVAASKISLSHEHPNRSRGQPPGAAALEGSWPSANHLNPTCSGRRQQQADETGSERPRRR